MVITIIEGNKTGNLYGNKTLYYLMDIPGYKELPGWNRYFLPDTRKTSKKTDHLFKAGIIEKIMGL